MSFSVLTWILAALTCSGTLSNLLCLSFFITHAPRNTGSRILCLLNALDLMTCGVSTVTLIIGYISSNQDSIRISFIAFNFCFAILLEGSAFVTCILTVTRTISVCRPFYHIDQKILAGTMAVYFLYLIGRGFLYLYVAIHGHKDIEMIGLCYDAAGFSSLSLMIITVVIADVLAVRKLTKSRKSNLLQITNRIKHVTVTVVILSVLFCCLSMAFVTVLGMQLAGCSWVDGCVNHLVYEYGIMGISLNSAVNPVVYFARKRDLREFVLRNFNCIRRKRDLREFVLRKCYCACIRRLFKRTGVQIQGGMRGIYPLQRFRSIPPVNLCSHPPNRNMLPFPKNRLSYTHRTQC